MGCTVCVCVCVCVLCVDPSNLIQMNEWMNECYGETEITLLESLSTRWQALSISCTCRVSTGRSHARRETDGMWVEHCSPLREGGCSAGCSTGCGNSTSNNSSSREPSRQAQTAAELCSSAEIACESRTYGTVPTSVLSISVFFRCGCVRRIKRTLTACHWLVATTCTSHLVGGPRLCIVMCVGVGSLQKVQGHRAAQGHRAGVHADSTPPTGGLVGHACR